ncbi:CBU_0592 family membrane protein [Salininema proteolyticum]|uniref:CBU-0592-like domain-containing protein n=1 Tax=Salininema proteolyticum TaxID=1607685 RepID=A0ABV8U3W9_9ACTN
MPEFDVRIALQFIGAALYIAQYILVQSRRIEATAPLSLLLIGIGALFLLVSASMGFDWGLMLLNATWIVMVSGTFIVRRRKRSCQPLPELAPEEEVRAEGDLLEPDPEMFAEPSLATYRPVPTGAVY